ncbi:hypothetical protein LJR129_000032 [Acidovorax sp. LjRoot129]|uniref:hypothetical protein n=1 Tax=Acidovorax sp. LjRoot129 TaxID=3342260 RepID=UPI003ECEAEA2
MSSSNSKENRREDGGVSNETEGSGKVAQAHNATGDQPTTQLNQGRRTPESRHDRDAHLGSGNQVQSRRGAGGGGNGGGSRGAG